MSGPDCMWCGMTRDAHRESGPVAKTPCGMLKRGFVAAKPPTQIVDLSEAFKQTSVGDLASPVPGYDYASPEDKLIHERERARMAERAAVVKYLRHIAEHAMQESVRVAFDYEARAIEKGEHLK